MYGKVSPLESTAINNGDNNTLDSTVSYTEEDINATSSIARRGRRRRPPQILTYETMGLPR